jgi:ribosome biogenesis GTPase A
MPALERSDIVSGLIDRAMGCETAVGTVDAGPFRSLGELKDRLTGGRLQLAVLGQFKRGKSTLLNALLGLELLPIGVLPVTAIPTFLEVGASAELEVEFRDGRKESEVRPDTLDRLRQRIADLVSEAGNPANVRGVARVTIRIASSLLGQNVVLIDTPGVGSTHRHNTEAAEAVLPACDAALFVVSPDPPITEVEVAYLARIRSTVGRVILVLNKADTLTPAEADAVEGFLKRTLAERADLTDAPIFRLSARMALHAKMAADPGRMEDSGIARLEAFLTDFVAREKRAVLALAIGRKARAIVAELGFHTAMRLKALQLPLDDLEHRGQVFAQAVGGFEAERRLVHDLLAADRKRALDALDAAAVQLRARLAAALEREVERRTAAGQAEDDAWLTVQKDLPELFGAQLRQAIATAGASLATAFGAHQKRVDDLTDLVVRTAAELLEVPFRRPDRVATFEAKVLPYWQLSRPEALNPLPPGAFDFLLTTRMRRRHAHRRVLAAISDVVLRNVENLRWAMRRNVDDAFRRFAADLDVRFANSLAATREVMGAAITARSLYAGGADSEIAALKAAAGELEAIEAGLTANLATWDEPA